ncbi:MAG: hypothetical protein V1820_05565 [archaeon]
MTLILDTSLVLELFRYKRLDLIELKQLSSGKILVPSAVAHELVRLGKGPVLEYLLKGGCKQLPGEAHYADREIGKLIESSGEVLVVGTQDFALVRKLKSFKGKFRHLFLRGKRKLVISGGN